MMNYEDIVVANVADPDDRKCVCGGTGLIPINNDEDVQCPYHCSEACSPYYELRAEEIVTEAEATEILDIWNGETDQEFIDGYINR